MNNSPALSALFFAALAFTMSDAALARGSGGHGHKGGHHRSHLRPPLFPYAYSPVPAYSNRYRPSCASNPELAECIRERERERMIFPPSDNASG